MFGNHRAVGACLLSVQQPFDLAAGRFEGFGELVGQLAAGLGHVGPAAAAAIDHRGQPHAPTPPRPARARPGRGSGRRSASPSSLLPADWPTARPPARPCGESGRSTAAARSGPPGTSAITTFTPPISTASAINCSTLGPPFGPAAACFFSWRISLARASIRSGSSSGGTLQRSRPPGAAPFGRGESGPSRRGRSGR